MSWTSHNWFFFWALIWVIEVLLYVGVSFMEFPEMLILYYEEGERMLMMSVSWWTWCVWVRVWVSVCLSVCLSVILLLFRWSGCRQNKPVCQEHCHHQRYQDGKSSYTLLNYTLCHTCAILYQALVTATLVPSVAPHYNHTMPYRYDPAFTFQDSHYILGHMTAIPPNYNDLEIS